jgi:hypothetical protein
VLVPELVIRESCGTRPGARKHQVVGEEAIR